MPCCILKPGLSQLCEKYLTPLSRALGPALRAGELWLARCRSLVCSWPSGRETWPPLHRRRWSRSTVFAAMLSRLTSAVKNSRVAVVSGQGLHHPPTHTPQLFMRRKGCSHAERRPGFGGQENSFLRRGKQYARSRRVVAVKHGLLLRIGETPGGCGSTLVDIPLVLGRTARAAAAAKRLSVRTLLMHLVGVSSASTRTPPYEGTQRHRQTLDAAQARDI